MGKPNPNVLAAQMQEAESEFQNQVCHKCQALIMEGECLCPDGPSFDEPAQQPVKSKAPQAPRPPVAAPPVPASPPAPMPGGGMPTAKDMLMKLTGAPSAVQIESWKAQYGKIYVLPLDRDEAYVWRYLNYQEFKKLRGNKALVENEEKFQEHVVMNAVLWPTMGPVELAGSRAGLIPTLFGVIMKGSYFLDTDTALTLIDEL